MSRTHYLIYQEQTFVLAKTLIVKHEEIASSMNTELYYRGYVVDSNPYNWRYYLNLSGQYHVADKDSLYETYGTEHVMIKLPSDDGPVEVPLTKELLYGPNADKSLINEYQIGSRFYKELISRYPDYETLIIGIINPIDIDVAIKADNGEILFIAGRYKRITEDRKWFDEQRHTVNEILIEPQEDNLILELQTYIDTFLRHWNNPDYAPGNDLYVVTMLGILYCNIPNAVSNIRLGNCKTIRAHTFHIREYLESHGQIGRYIDFIPIATSLWLYRNATYLEANSGKQLTFDALLDNALSPNQIPMSAYSARHELSNMSDDKLLPTGMHYKEVLNFEVIGASDNDRTVRDILDDQIDLARDNDKDLDEKQARIQNTLDWGGDDRINTKVLESEMMELGEPYPFTLQQFLFNMWGYTAARGYYAASAFATNPLTGDRLSFSTKNAYIMVMYCLNKAVAGITLDKIPSVRLYNIPRTNVTHNLPLDPEYTEKPSIDIMMGWCSDKTRRRKVVEIVGSQEPDFYALDSSEFFDNVNDIYHERVRRYNTYCDVEEYEERGDLELITKRLYWMGFEEELSPSSYSEWFRTVGFSPGDFNDDDLLKIGLELLASATGVIDHDPTRKRWLQKSILAIMRHFISYSVHIIEKFADGVVAYLEGQTLRFSDLKWSYIGAIPVIYDLSLELKMDTVLHIPIHLDISNVFENTVVDINSTVNFNYEISDLLFGQTRHRLNVGIYALNAEVKNIEIDASRTPLFEITMVDDSVNAFILTPISAALRDSNWIADITPDSTATTLDIISAKLNDHNLLTTGFDYDNQGTILEGFAVDINDDLSNTERGDIDVVSIVGIGVGLSDDPIDPIEQVDIDAVIITDMTISYNDDVSVSGFSKDGLLLGDISGSTVDHDVDEGTIESDRIDINGIGIRFADPQIPEVVSPADNVGLTVVNMTGRSDSANIEYVSSDNDKIDINDVTVKFNDSSVSLATIYDLNSVTINGITMSRRDVAIHTRQLDVGQAIIVGDITVSSKDNIISNTNADVAGITLNNIGVKVTDDYNAQGYSRNKVDISDITVRDEYDSINVVAPRALDIITINDLTVTQTDLAKYYPLGDIDAVVVSDITVNYNDVDIVINQVDDVVNTILIAGVCGRVTDKYNVSGSDDVNGVAVEFISASVSDSNAKSSANENTTLDVDHGLFTLNLNDIEVAENVSDSKAVYIDHSDITLDVRNPEIIFKHLELDTVIGNSTDISIVITDETEKYDMPTEVSGIAILTDAITLRQLDTMSMFDESGIIIESNAITVSQLDTMSITDTQGVTIDDKSINVNQSDADETLTSEDNPNAIQVNAGRIIININDESDDSNSQP